MPATDYPLSGKHHLLSPARSATRIDLVAAAAGEKLAKKENPGTRARYAGLDYANCAPCHRDAHAGKFGGTCAECHTTAGFQQIVGNKFDHAQTDYPLTGRHAHVACARCHTSGDMTAPVAHAACRDCHKDAHAGQFAQRIDGDACESCHSTAGFVPARYGVDEHAQSKYPLTGSHLAVPCISCHAPAPGQTTARFAYTDTRCQSCHQDEHSGQLDIWIAKNGCEFCHDHRYLAPHLVRP